MSDTTDTTEAGTEAEVTNIPTEAVDTTATTEVPDEPGTDEPEADSANAEAARYRRKLRNAESERDGLAQRLEAMQRAEVERLAGQHLAKGQALWAGGVQLADLLSEDGTINAEAVRDAAQAARAELGLSAPPRGLHIASEGANPRPSGPSDTKASMRDAVMGRSS